MEAPFGASGDTRYGTAPICLAKGPPGRQRSRKPSRSRATRDTCHGDRPITLRVARAADNVGYEPPQLNFQKLTVEPRTERTVWRIRVTSSSAEITDNSLAPDIQSALVGSGHRHRWAAAPGIVLRPIMPNDVTQFQPPSGAPGAFNPTSRYGSQRPFSYVLGRHLAPLLLASDRLLDTYIQRQPSAQRTRSICFSAARSDPSPTFPNYQYAPAVSTLTFKN